MRSLCMNSRKRNLGSWIKYPTLCGVSSSLTSVGQGHRNGRMQSSSARLRKGSASQCLITAVMKLAAGTGHVYSSDNYPAPNEYTTWVKMTRHGETTTEEWPTDRVRPISKHG